MRMGLANSMGMRAGARVSSLPPPAPGPLDRLVPELNGLDAFTTPYTAVHTNLIVRIVARNNANSIPVLTCSFGAQELDLIGLSAVPIAGTTVVAAFGFRGTPTGTRTLSITASSGSVGRAAVRVGELAALAASWLGMVAFSETDSNSNVSAAVPNYYAEVDAACEAPGGSIVGTLVGWQDDRAYPITASYPDDAQFETWQTGMAARFAQADSPSGELGIGNPGDLYVFYAAYGTLHSPSAMIFELIGAVLP